MGQQQKNSWNGNVIEDKQSLYNYYTKLCLSSLTFHQPVFDIAVSSSSNLLYNDNLYYWQYFYVDLLNTIFTSNFSCLHFF